MFFLPTLNLDGVYAHKKLWHANTKFLTRARISQLNELLDKINTRLNTSPSVSHQALYERFSSTYFWQSIKDHEKYLPAKQIWDKTHLIIYADNDTLVWLSDYALPLLEEYLTCAQKEAEALSQETQSSLWQSYLPGHTDYINSLKKLNTCISQLQLNLMHLKAQWAEVANTKITQHNDVLKYIAQKIQIPCAFDSIDLIPTHAFVFIKQTLPPIDLPLPQNQLDKNPPIIAITEATTSWQALSLRLQKLKKRYHYSAPSSIPPDSFWPKWAMLYQAKLFIIQTILTYASLPIMVGLFFSGWLSMAAFSTGIVLWALSPLLKKIFTNVPILLQKIDRFLDRYTESFVRGFLIDSTEFIETLERSALWRKNRLASGCHHLNSFDPSLIVPTYKDFLHTLKQQIIILEKTRPYFWQLWRQETRILIDEMITELSLECTHLNHTMLLYAADIATRINQPMLPPSAAVFSIKKLTPFVTQFAPHTLNLLNLENKAIHYFLSSLCEKTDGPVLLRRLLSAPRYFATHCCDVLAINSLLDEIKPFIHCPKKLQAITHLAKLIKQEQNISPQQINNYVQQLADDLYSQETILNALQIYLCSTFNGEFFAARAFFTPLQHQSLADWLVKKQGDLTAARQYFQDFLDLPNEQDWGKMPAHFDIITPQKLQDNLALIELEESRIIYATSGEKIRPIRQLLQAKLIELAPNYTGNPSAVNKWPNILWQQQCPITLDEIILQARFGWMLETISHNKDLIALDSFMLEATQLFTRADNDNRLSKALVGQPIFYLPWNNYIQTAVDKLEQKGLLLPNARAAYSQKALQQWLQQS